MKKLIISIIVISIFVQPVFATEILPPTAPPEAQEFLPDNTTTFGEDVLYIIRKAINAFLPSLAEAANACVTVLVICIFISMLNGFNGLSARAVELVGALCIAITLLTPSNSLIKIGIQSAEGIAEYGKQLIPVLTTALAAEGGTVTSATLYTGTILFITLLIMGITRLLVPMLYAYIALSIAISVINEPVLLNIHKFFKWIMVWILKLSIYFFTGYLGITGVITGSVDAAAVKAAKIAISGTIPVIGNVISDASETILVSAGLMKGTVGTYGLLAIIAVWIGPFIQIGSQYLALKITSAVSSVFGSKNAVKLIDNFSSAMGYVVAMTGTICLLLFVSTVCFMRGVG